MGEPTPGSIVDNIFLSVQQIKLAADIVGNAGDWLVRSSGDPWFILATTGNAQGATHLGFAQARVDFDTTGETDGDVSIEALTPPSYVYAIAEGALGPGDLVALADSGSDGSIIKATAADLAAGFVIGRYSRLAVDQAGNNVAATGDVIIVKLGVV